MNRKLLYTVCFILFCCNAYSQMYMRIYTFTPLSSQRLNKDSYFLEDDYHLHKNLSHSISDNQSIGLIVGKHLNKNAMVELGVEYYKDRYHWLYYHYINSNPDTRKDENAYFDVITKVFLIKPSFVFQLSNNNKFRPYMKVGPLIGLPKAKETHVEKAVYQRNFERIKSKEFKSHGALGVHGSLGIDIKLKGVLGVFCEITQNVLSYTYSEATVTSYAVNGEEFLDVLSINNTKIDYAYKFDNHDNFKQDIRGKMYKEKYSLTNLGVTAGVKIYLFGKK